MKKNLLVLALCLTAAAASAQNGTLTMEHDSIEALTEIIRNMPNIAVGKGVTFQPRNNSYKMTMRFRMQNMALANFDDGFVPRETQAQVKRLRLRFDGYIYTPKLTYSLQLGFTPYDTRGLPNENTNIVRDAMIYYVPNPVWNIGFGQTKIRANRARVNSSSALQFVDRSIVNSQFNIDRDFGVFGEFYKCLFSDFNMSLKGSVTLGEGRNMNTNDNSGLAYTARLELFPIGRFKALGDVVEGDFERENTPKIMVAGAYSFNDRATRLNGQSGASMPDGEMRDLHSYFVDFIMKYQGFAFYTDFMGRVCDRPFFDGSESAYVYTGCGLNFQTSYLFRSNWEVAARNSTLIPQRKVRDKVGYESYNQTTIGVTRYLIGHSLKVQGDVSYNHRVRAASPDYNRWEVRFQIELGL